MCYRGCRFLSRGPMGSNKINMSIAWQEHRMRLLLLRTAWNSSRSSMSRFYKRQTVKIRFGGEHP